MRVYRYAGTAVVRAGETIVEQQESSEMADVPVFGDPRWLQKVQHLRCRECGTSTSKPATCFFCGCVTCPKCTRHGKWGVKSRKIGRAHVELQSPDHLVCRLLLEKKKKTRFSALRPNTRNP